MLGMLVVLGTAVAGCHRDFLNENDRLRAQVVDLENRVAALERRKQELETELEHHRPAPGAVPAEIRANTPHVTAVEIGPLSHVHRSAGDRERDQLLLYVAPRDGLGRFVQLVGRMSVHAAILPEGQAAQTIASRSLSPAELRAAYRSSVTGTHYTVEVPIDVARAVRAGIAACDVSLVYTDGRTGRRFEAHRAVRLK